MGTTTTGAVNEGLFYTLAISALLFAAIVFFLVLFLVRYRSSVSPKAKSIHGNPWFEIAAFVLPTLIALSFFAVSLHGYEFLRRVPQGALQVEVHARQFAYSFIYPDGKKSSQLIVPVGSDVKLNIISEDVLHGVYIPAMHIQVDAVPKMPTYAWFHAQDIGTFDILCTAYCGTGHSDMEAKLRIINAADFQKWKAGGIDEFPEGD